MVINFIWNFLSNWKTSQITTSFRTPTRFNFLNEQLNFFLISPKVRISLKMPKFCCQKTLSDIEFSPVIKKCYWSRHLLFISKWPPPAWNKYVINVTLHPNQDIFMHQSIAFYECYRSFLQTEVAAINFKKDELGKLFWKLKYTLNFLL